MAKHIGIVACSAEGAALCYQTICKEGSAIMGQHTHPEISMHNHPLSKYMDLIYMADWKGVASLMISSAVKLAKIGADFFVCPDNTIHQAFDMVKSKSPLPWLHIAEEVVKIALLSGFKKVGILGTKYLMTGPVYAHVIQKAGMDYYIPDEIARKQIDHIIFNELVYGEIVSASKNFFLDVVDRMKKERCDAVILGCTEIPLIVLPGESPLPVLEIGVGTGRLFNAAIQSKADIYGIDISRSMLDILLTKLDPEHHQRIFLQDAVNFNLYRKFDLIIAPFRVYSHIMQVEDQLKALNNAAEHLSDQGMIASGLSDVKDFEGEYEPGRTFSRTVNMKADIVHQISDITMTMKWMELDKERVEEFNFKFRFYFRYEVEHLVARSPLTLENMYGDFYENEMNSDSREMVVVCRKG